jgi:type IV pilus assembly protein PilN
MIRINLLPIKTSRRQEAVKSELMLAGAAAGGVLLLLVGFQLVLQSSVNKIDAENTILKQEIDQVQNIVNEVKQMEEMKVELQKKLSVIKQLKAKKTGPVHMLDQLTKATPEKLQLISLDEKRGRIEITGVAVSNEIISQFLSNLEKSEYFTDVFLNEIDQSEKDGVKLKDFSISARLVVPGSTGTPDASSEG